MILLESLGAGYVVDPIEWEGPVSIAALAPPTDCLETTRVLRGKVHKHAVTSDPLLM